MKPQLIVLWLILTQVCLAQNTTPIRGNQQWVQYYGQGTLNDRWAITLDGGFRWKNDLGDKSQYIVRTGVTHSFNSGLKVAAGFAHLGFYGGDEVNLREHRPYQELGYSHFIQSFQINHRIRLEERFFDPVGFSWRDQQPNRFTLRWRYGLSANVALFSINDSMRASLTIGNEIFLNLASEKGLDFFDQNRLTLSPTLHINDQLSFAFTWNRQASYPKIADKHQYNSVLWLQVKHNLML